MQKWFGVCISMNLRNGGWGFRNGGDLVRVGIGVGVNVDLDVDMDVSMWLFG